MSTPVSNIPAHWLGIDPTDLPIERVSNFYIHAFIIEENDVLLVDDDQVADGIGVYARLQEGTSVHVKDFNIDRHDNPRQAAQDLADSLNTLLQADQPQSPDTHLEAEYEDRVSGWED
jgi:hypothetical protein